MGVADPGQVAREGAGDLDVQPRGPVPTGVELRAVLPGPALKQGAVDDQLGRGVQVLHDWYLVAEGAGYQGCAGTNHPGGGGLGDAADLSEQPLGKAVPQPGSGPDAHTGTPPAPGPRRPAGGRRRGSSRTDPGHHRE